MTCQMGHVPKHQKYFPTKQQCKTAPPWTIPHRGCISWRLSSHHLYRIPPFSLCFSLIQSSFAKCMLRPLRQEWPSCSPSGHAHAPCPRGTAAYNLCSSALAWSLLMCFLDMIVDNTLACTRIPTDSDHTAHGVQVWVDVDAQFMQGHDSTSKQ